MGIPAYIKIPAYLNSVFCLDPYPSSGMEPRANLILTPLYRNKVNISEFLNYADHAPALKTFNKMVCNFERTLAITPILFLNNVWNSAVIETFARK